MRVILIADLHIKPGGIVANMPWIDHFCDYLNSKYAPETLIIVLGDIVDSGAFNKQDAYFAADAVFSYINSKLSLVNYKIAFVPGNHDYCDENLDYFTEFCRKHQTLGDRTFDFSKYRTANYLWNNINLVFTDTVQDGKYGLPGYLDLESIRSCLHQDKTPSSAPLLLYL